MNISFYEIIGYIASVVVLISITSKSMIKFRAINLLGAIIFSIYALLINAIPILILNLIIIIVNIYFLYKFFTEKESFSFYFANYKNNFSKRYIEQFFKLYRDDIKKFFPDFDFKIKLDYKILLIFRNLKPAGLILLENFKKENFEIANTKKALSKDLSKEKQIYENLSEEYEIILDYVTPEYRDFKIGKYIFIDHQEVFDRIGAKKIYVKTTNKQHIKYLKKMKFSSSTYAKVWEKTLDEQDNIFVED